MTVILNPLIFHEPNSYILWLMTYSGAYAMTLLLETPVYVSFLWRKGGWLRAVAVSGLMNSMTLPVVWFVMPPYLIHNYILFFVVAELFAWLGEAALIRMLVEKVSWRRAILAAFVANAISASAGLAVSFVLAPYI